MMDTNKYVILNGESLKRDEPVFFSHNRGFRFGDAVFESMHANGTETQFFQEHFIRLTKGMKELRMKVPENFKAPLIYAQIKSLLVRNKLFKGARIRLTVFREGGGTYTPEDNQVSYVIECEKLPVDRYELNQRGLIIDVFHDAKKSIHFLSSFKHANSLLYVMAALYKKENNFDDVLLMNDNGNIAEATSSNIFIVKDNQIYTPSVDEGCVAGIMRNKIIEFGLQLQYTVFDDCSVKIDDLLEADEVFLTNAVAGIKWVMAFQKRRYFNKTARILTGRLNEVAFN